MWHKLWPWRSPNAAPAAATPPLAAHLQSGQAAERRAEALLRQAGLQVIERNYKTPGRGGGEIDLIARHGDTLVFVEVRQRRRAEFGSALASIGTAKQQRWLYAAQVYLRRFKHTPPCRFDVVVFDGEQAPQWLQGVMPAESA